jgi:ribosomal protein S18 acetylase RimI-like enzyme
MLEPLAWDSTFFNRRIGAVKGPWTEAAVGADVAAARAQGYDYLTARPPVDDAAAVRAVEQAGFYLTDIGVTWSSNVDRYLGENPAADGGIRAAAEGDLEWLRPSASALFVQSRFYHDPFYSAAAANRMHAAWIENSVRGAAADAVLVLDQSGFVTCKIGGDGAGHIVLIGVADGAQRRGSGRALMTAALGWFRGRGVQEVMVKTQVKNLKAMNFYRGLGFALHGADLTFGCRLSGAEAV